MSRRTQLGSWPVFWSAIWFGSAAPAGVYGQANEPLPLWSTDGSVSAIAATDTTVYIGGGFDEVGPASPGFAVFDPISAARDVRFPAVDGSVLALAGDGAGGWYIGGRFTRVGSLSRRNLAHVLADGRVSDWDPSPDGPVRAIAVNAVTVYVAGDFTQVGGQARQRLAAVSRSTGDALGWDPQPNMAVRTIAVMGSTVYVGGEFTTFRGGSFRPYLAALDTSVGNPTAWVANVDSLVTGLATSGNLLYVVGYFSQIRGQSRSRAACIDSSTGEPTAWAPDLNGWANTVAVAPGRVYLGGVFTQVNGINRNRAAAVNDSDGALDLAWNPDPDMAVTSIAADGAVVYVAGNFNSIGGQPRRNVAAVSAATGLAAPWDARLGRQAGGDWVTVVGVWRTSAGARVAVGGEFYLVGAKSRTNLAAIDVATGEATSWDPQPNGGVSALALNGTTLYVAGMFTEAGGQPRNYIAALRTSDGQAVPGWDPNASWYVYGLAAYGTTVYATFGDNVTIGGATRNYIAALRTSDGLATSWDPNPNQWVVAIAPVGTLVYVGGSFTFVGGQARAYIAALDESTGDATAWNPGANSGVGTLVVGGWPSLYVGGGFTSIGGQMRNRIAELDRSIDVGNATSWNPDADASVTTLAQGNLLFASGLFDNIGGQVRDGTAALRADLATNNATGWDPRLNNLANALAVDPSGRFVYAGGGFTTAGGRPRKGLAAFCLCDTPPTNLQAAAAGNNSVELTWAATGSPPSYTIHRSRRSGGPYTLIGTSSELHYTDTTAEGGTRYYYVVRANNNACDSDPSNEATATTAGGCGLPPDFEGALLARPISIAGCAVALNWLPAKATCAPTITYSIYRSNDPAFIPSRANRILTDLPIASYTDDAALAPGTTYYYVVRATGMENGEEDQNLIRHEATTDAACAPTVPPRVPFFSSRSGDGEMRFNWVNPPGVSNTRVVCRDDFYPSAEDPLAELIQPMGQAEGGVVRVAVPEPNGTPRYCQAYAAGSVAPPYAFPWWTWGFPGDTTGSFKWLHTTCGIALGKVGVAPGRGYFAVSNDRIVYGLTPGAAGGDWATNWIPVKLDAPSQARPTSLPLRTTLVQGSSFPVLVSSQDGHVYAVNGDTGDPLWISDELGTAVQAAASAMVKDYGGAFDLVFAGTRDSVTDNKLYALDLLTGSTTWVFDNGGHTGGLGIITSVAYVDYVNRRVVFTTRKKGGGSQDTVWCVRYGTGSPELHWSVGGSAPNLIGDIEAGPTMANGRIYVGDIDGRVYALDPETGAVQWSYASGTNLPVKGNITTYQGRVYFTSGDSVFALNADGSEFWASPVNVPGVSAPVIVGGRLYVGGGDSSLHSIDATAPTPAPPTSLALGPPWVKIVGSPSYDVLTGLLVVGCEDGAIYAVAPPF